MATEYLRSRILPTLDKTVGREALIDYYERHPEEFKLDDAADWQDIFIGYVENGPEDWSFGHGRAQYVTGELAAVGS